MADNNDKSYLAISEYNSSMAEEQLAGAIFIDPNYVIRAIRGTVAVSDFEFDEPRAVYVAACQLVDEGAILDPVKIQERAHNNGTELSKEYIAGLMANTPTAANCEVYAEIVHNASIERETRVIGFDLGAGCISPEKAVERLQSAMNGKKVELPTPEEDAVYFTNYVQDVSEGKKGNYLSTGFNNLDKILGSGLIKSGLIVLAARPGMGKTTLGLAIADNLAAAGHKVLYESLEMNREQLWARRCGRLAKLSYSSIQSGKDIPEGAEGKNWWGRFLDATICLAGRPMQISDANAKLDDIERHIRSIKGLSAVIIDHIGLIQFDNDKDSRHAGMTKISNRLKRIARSMGIPILALCQLNRDVEGRMDKRPQLSDLRDSGAIEEDADAVIMLYRPEYYLAEAEQTPPYRPQTLEVLVKKNRHGQTGKVTMQYTPMIAEITE